MEIFSFSAHLRLRHPSMDPQVITAALGVEPQRAWIVGQARPYSGGVYDHTYWTSLSKRGEDSGLLSVLDSDLTWLEQKRTFIDGFIDTFGWVDYYISWFASERSGGDQLNWSLLKRLSDLRINLSLDVYSTERPDGPEILVKTPGSG